MVQKSARNFATFVQNAKTSVNNERRRQKLSISCTKNTKKVSLVSHIFIVHFRWTICIHFQIWNFKQLFFLIVAFFYLLFFDSLKYEKSEHFEQNGGTDARIF